MQDTSMLGKTKAHCLSCGKEIVVRSIRDKSGQYCSRVCASRSRFMTRYSGSMAGPMDRPDPMSKSKWEGGDTNAS